MGIKLKEAADTFSKEEKQQAFLLKLSDALRPLDNPVDIEETVTKIAMDFMDAERCHYCTIEGDNIIILRDAVRGDLSSVVGVYPISSYPMFKAVLDAGRPFIVDDVHTSDIIDEELKQLFLQLQNISFINVPVIKNGKPVGLLSLVQSKPRKWTDTEVQLTIETAERTWAAVERAKAEEALRKSEEKYRTLFTYIDQGFAFCELVRNKEGKGIDFYVLEVNPTYEKQAGVSMEMVLGKTILQVFPELDKWWIETYAAVVDDQRPAVFEQYFEITQRWFEIKAYPSEKDRFAVLFSDITERKLAEEKIKESEKQFKNVLLQSPNIFVILEGFPEMIITFANEPLFKSWGRTAAIIGKPLLEVLPEIKDQPFPKLLQQVFETGETYNSSEEKAVIIKNGAPVDTYFVYVYQPIFNDTRKVTGVTIMATDITEQVLARKRIEESGEQFRNLVEQAPVAFCFFRGDNFVVEVANEKQLQLTGKTKEQVMNIPAFASIPETVGQGYQDIVEGVYKTGIPFIANESPLTILHNGKEVTTYITFILKPFYNAEHKIDGVFSVTIEVTEQVLARKKIEESEKKFEAAILAVNGIIWTNNANGEMMGEQLGWANLTGQSFEQYQGYGWAKAVHPDDAQPTVDAWNKAVATNSTFEFEHRVKTKQNAWRLFSVKAIPVLDENGIIQQWVGVHTDITEQKLAQEKLAYRTALLEAHNEASVDGLLLVDAKGKILSFNQRFVEIWNMPPHIVTANDDEAALSFAMTQLIHPQQFIDKVKYFYEHPEETCHDELEFKDGKVVERNGYPVVGKGSIYYAWSWTFKDITQRKRVEQDLKNTKEQLELTFKNIPAGVYLINAKGEMVYLNDRGAAVYGDFTAEYIMEHKDLSTLLKIADELFERFDENGNYFSSQNSPAFISLTTGKPSQAILKQINRVTREQRWYYVQGAPLFDEKGNVSLVLITSTDITEQKNAEEKIKYSEERFRSLAQTLPQLVWVTDVQGNAEFVSPRWQEYSGIEPGGEKEWKAIVHPDDFDNINATWMHCLNTGDTYTFDVRLKSKNGEYRWFRVMGEPVLDKENTIVKWVGAFTDIHLEKLFTQDLELKVIERTNELKQFNIELEKKNKELESFAYISSHDLQEPLRKIQILATRIIERESLSEIGRDNFSRMQLAAKRMQTLIEDLLTYSKTSTDDRKFENTNLHTIINDVKEDLSEEIKEKNATIETAELGDIKIIPFQFRQLMHNLIGNALKFSVPNRIPHIQIKSEIAYGRQFNNEKLKSENKYCHITVSDNGIGFEQQYSEKIFEVFQRLHGKSEYQGTGIGLSIVKKIIENHEGIITANSELNKGTTFNIYIPVR